MSVDTDLFNEAHSCSSSSSEDDLLLNLVPKGLAHFKDLSFVGFKEQESGSSKECNVEKNIKKDQQPLSAKSITTYFISIY